MAWSERAVKFLISTRVSLMHGGTPKRICTYSLHYLGRRRMSGFRMTSLCCLPCITETLGPFHFMQQRKFSGATLVEASNYRVSIRRTRRCSGA